MTQPRKTGLLNRWPARIAVMIMGALFVAYLVVPGQHRVLTPGWFGMSQVAPDIWIDDLDRTDRVLFVHGFAETRTAEFFGTLHASPTVFYCTTQACRQRFGIKTSGLSINHRYILLAPHGVNGMIATHERVHAELHWRGSWMDFFAPTFPVWFDEGFASLISRDFRLDASGRVDQVQWVTNLRDWRDWRREVSLENWPEIYGASLIMVADLRDRLGCEGLLDFVNAVGDGANFDDLLDALPPRPVDAQSQVLHVRPC